MQKTLSSNSNNKACGCLFSSSNKPQRRHSFLLTALSVPPCESSTFIVCLLLRDELNPQSHWLILSRWRMAFSAAYQMSLGSSVVVAAIQRGWITLIKAIFALLNSSAEVGWWHFECSKPGYTGSFKRSGWYWCELRWVFRDALQYSLCRPCFCLLRVCVCVRGRELELFGVLFVLKGSSTTKTHLISHPADWSFSSLTCLNTNPHKQRSKQRLAGAVC